MIAAEMLVRIAADVAQLKSGMEEAKASVTNASAGMEQALGIAKNALIAFVGVGSVMSFANMIGGIIESRKALGELAITTGMSAAALLEFSKIGSYTGQTMDSIAGMSVKLSKGLATATNDTKGAAAGVTALGLNWREIKNMAPEDQMLAIAQRMGEYKDGADKTALATLLFGRSGATALPFLKDLGEQASTVAGKLTEQEIATKKVAVAMATDYENNLKKLSKQQDAWKKDVADGMLPALDEISKALVAVGSGANGVGNSISQVAKDGTFSDWIRGATIGLSYLIDVGQALVNVIRIIGLTLTGMVAATVTSVSSIGESFGKLATGDFKGATESMKAGFEGVKAIGEATGEDVAKVWGAKLLGEQFRDRLKEVKGLGAETKETGTKTLDLSDALTKAGKVTDEYAAAMKRLAAQIAAAKQAGEDYIITSDKLQAEAQNALDLGRQLNAQEKAVYDLDEKITQGKIILTAAQYAMRIETIANTEAMREELKQQQESRKENEASLDAIYKKTEGIRAETEKMQAENDTILLTVEQMRALKLTRIEEMAVAQDKLAQWAEENMLGQAVVQTHKDLADAYRKSAAEVDRGDHLKAAKAAADEWRKTVDSVYTGLTDALARAFDSGKGFFDTLWNGIRDTFSKSTMKLVVQTVSGLAIGGATGDANAMTSGLSGLTQLGKMATTVGDMFKSGGIMDGANGFATNITNSVSKVAESLFDHGFEALGTSLETYSATIGTYAQMAGEAFGYLNATVLASQGKWGAAIGSAAGTYFFGPLGGQIGAAIGGLVDKLFGNETNIKHGGAYTMGAQGTDPTKMWGPGGGDFPEQMAQRAMQGTVKGINSLFALMESKTRIANFSAGAETDGTKNEGYSFAGGTLNNGTKFGDIQSGGAFGHDSHNQAGKAATDKDAMGNYLQEMSQATLEALQAATDVPKAIRDQLKGIDIEALTGTELSGLTTAIMDIIRGTTLLRAALNTLPFENLKNLSFDAASGLVTMAGGLDKLLGKLQSYYDNYYTTDEKNTSSAGKISAELKAAGIDPSTISTKDDFRKAFEGLNASTEAGRTQITAMLNVATGFASIAEWLKTNKESLGQAGDKATPTEALLTTMTTTGQTNATATAAVVVGVDQSNILLTGISATITTGNTAIVNAVSNQNAALGGIVTAVNAVVSVANATAAAATAAVAGVAQLATNAGLTNSQPNYRYNLGGGEHTV